MLYYLHAVFPSIFCTAYPAQGRRRAWSLSLGTRQWTIWANPLQGTFAYTLTYVITHYGQFNVANQPTVHVWNISMVWWDKNWTLWAESESEDVNSQTLAMKLEEDQPRSTGETAQIQLWKACKKNYPRKLGGNCCQRCIYKVLNKGSEWLSKWEGLSICVILCKVNLIHFNLRYFCGCKCRINERSQWRMARLVWAHKEATISKKNTL